jgi:hypothetical protein
MPVNQTLDYHCDNFATCGTPDAAGVTGLQPGWAQLQIQYADGGGTVHNYNIVLCPVDTPKFVNAFPSVQFNG